MNKIYIMSLGCPRNLLDSEVLQGSLKKKGFTISDMAEDTDVAIINTCGFIQDAKQESIDMILRLAELKKEGRIKRLIVTGCLSQRYPKELMDEIEEIDAVFGSSDFTEIPGQIDAVLAGERIKKVASTPGFLYDDSSERAYLTPPHYAYLKVQEGCPNRCSYCVIPDIRGPLRSRTIDSVIRETEKIKSERDLKELILIGQDITSFGTERAGRSELADLLKRLGPVMKNGWIRLLYTHPAHFTDDLINVIETHENICKYIDLPIQHINDEILRDMVRPPARNEITGLIGRIRSRINGVVLRTSVIVGFPGETDRQFKELLDFLKKERFERLGAFIYSREEGTMAAELKGQIPEEVKKARFDEVMKLQQEISRDNNLEYLDRTMKVLVDERIGGQEEPEPGRFSGRTYMDAPEVDGVVYVRGKDIRTGEFVDVKITGTMEYDLIGESV